jgi:hypothetical protein
MSDSRQQPRLTGKAGSAINELVYGRRIGPGIGTRVRNRLQYFLARFLPDRNELTFRHAPREQIAL